jgi:aromatic-L-amino-acid decarboxylase
VSPDDRSLDPSDWESFRHTLHGAVDEVVDMLATLRSRPAWQPVPARVKEALDEPLPHRGEALDEVVARFRELVFPYATGNLHPRFFGWVHGAGTPAGVLAELLAAGMNPNVGGREHAAVYVERAVVGWFRELFGFPDGASGVLTSGTSMGNLLAIVAARDAALGSDARALGTRSRSLVAYAGAGVHDSVSKAMRIGGLGTEALRIVEIDEALAISVPALRRRIAADRAAGKEPFLVVATAGSVDAGAFDPLGALADLCREEGLWLHVDGAFGALAILSPAHAHLVAGIERADSLAFDAHKWLQAPYAVGCVLFRDEGVHRAAFSSAPDYLARTEGGTAAGAPWFADYGLELSREFRALKVWFTLRHYGIERLGAAIGRTCELAALLAERITAAPELELLAPVALNVVCFRVHPAGMEDEAELERLNDAIAVTIQESGEAVPSTTRIGRIRALRICIINHRTREDDLDVLLAAVGRAAAEQLASASPAGRSDTLGLHEMPPSGGETG